MTKSLQKPWALITGASAGIGAATAVTLAEAGYRLFLLARRADRLESMARELGPRTEVRWASVDLRDRPALDEFFRARSRELGEIDLLVNNAGLARGVEKVQDAVLSDWDEMLETNVRALLALTRQVLPGMVARKKGHIVNVGSVAGRWVYPGGAVYCATKSAVKSISEGLRMDLLGTGIRVSTIEPGMVETEFSRVRLKDPAAASKVYENMVPLSARDIAETIRWCVERPAHVNIQELVVFPTDQAAVGQVHRGHQKEQA